MGYVAITAALFAAGAWLGRDLNGAVGIIAWIAAFAVLISMRFAARRSVPLTVAAGRESRSFPCQTGFPGSTVHASEDAPTASAGEPVRRSRR